MEHEIYLSGIGGQGIQLAAKIFALAAMGEGRQVMLNGFYGFEMRGGISLSTLAIGDGPLQALPVAAKVGSAIAMHHQYWEKPLGRLRPGALVLTDDAVLARLPVMPDHTVVAIAASEAAKEIGNPMVMGMVLMSAFAAATGLVLCNSLIAAMEQVVPSYRRQHIEANRRAIEAGALAITPLSHVLPLKPLGLEHSA